MGTTYILTSENLMMSILFTIAAAGFLLLVYRACHDTLTYNKKFKNVFADSFELVYEIQIPEKNGNQVIENIFELGGIDSVNLLAQNG